MHFIDFNISLSIRISIFFYIRPHNKTHNNHQKLTVSVVNKSLMEEGVFSKLKYQPHEQESMKIDSKGILQIQFNVITGKEDDIWVCIAPSLEVSGYGSSETEARESLEHNVDVYVNDLNELPEYKRIQYLTEQGWVRNKFFKKKFSKAFVDSDGILQNLENPRITLNTVAT